MICKNCKEKFRTIDIQKDKDKICYKCGFNNGKCWSPSPDIDTEIKKVSYKGEFQNQQTNKGESVNKTADTHIKEKLSPEFDDLIKTLQFPDKFYNILDRIVKREIQEDREKVNKVIEEWYLEHRRKGDGIGELYEELKLKLAKDNEVKI